MTKYLRKLTYIDLLFVGIGSVVGAGIFAVIGKTSKYSGQYTWLSTAIAGLIIYYISRSYIKINEIYNSNESEYLVVNEAFGEKLSNLVILSAIIGGIIICYIVAKAFGGYASSLFPISVQTAVMSCIVICAIINIMGIRGFAIANNITTAMGIIGLFLIIFMGIVKMFYTNESGNDSSNEIIRSEINNSIDNSFSLSGVAFSTYIMLFSYFGFETLIKFNEESINSKTDIRRAINLTVISTTVLYTIISYISLHYVPSDVLSKSNYPLVEVASKLTTDSTIIGYIKLAAVLLTFSTYLVILGATSRLMDKFIGNFKKDEKTEVTPSNIPATYIFFTTMLVVLMHMYNMSMITATTVGNFCVLLLFATVSISTEIVSTRKRNVDIKNIKTLKN
jgi:amino acid transporter